MRNFVLIALLCALSAPSTAFAFCGFFVAPGDAKLVNNATRVALMRHADRTVVSMQPDYQGPAEEFAMVVPVPEVLQKENVKTLDRSLFDTLDTFSSPRMSEYWEQDPCPKPKPRVMAMDASRSRSEKSMRRSSAKPTKGAFVKVEAKFAVGEYDIVVLNSNDAAALEGWLVDRKYKIPKGAAPYLAPYISSGMYFFVAKVNPERAKFEGDKAILSPLRFHYSSPDFTLPIRLGMINSKQEQDIVVFVLGETRYVPSNYPHAPIPTNIVVKDSVKNNFAAFYEGLYAKARKVNEDAIITEYVWEIATVQARGGQITQGIKCDPCTSPVSYFTPSWLLSLGLDVFGVSDPAAGLRLDQPPPPTSNNAPKKLVLTRLHGRFKPGSSDPDIMFQKAEPLQGGMSSPGRDGSMEKTSFHPDTNRFQGRYVILHKWTGEVACKKPRRGYWGAPPSGQPPAATPAGGPRFGGKKQKSADPAKYAKTKISYAPQGKPEVK